METRNILLGSAISIEGESLYTFDVLGETVVDLPGGPIKFRVLAAAFFSGGAFSTQDVRSIDAVRSSREDELSLILLLLVGSIVSEIPDGVDPVARFESKVLELIPDEVAASMADAHIDAFTIYEPGESKRPARADLLLEYQPFGQTTATEMANTFSVAMKKADGDVAKALRMAGYSRTNSTGVEIGVERNIVTASNAGLFLGAVARYGFSAITGLRHVSVVDDRTTDICIERDAVQLPLSDDYWKTNWPSLHWGCRSILEPIRGTFAATTKRPKIPPSPGFGKAPATVLAFLRRAGRVSAA